MYLILILRSAFIVGACIVNNSLFLPPLRSVFSVILVFLVVSNEGILCHLTIIRDRSTHRMSIHHRCTHRMSIHHIWWLFGWFNTARDFLPLGFYLRGDIINFEHFLLILNFVCLQKHTPPCQSGGFLTFLLKALIFKFFLDCSLTFKLFISKQRTELLWCKVQGVLQIIECILSVCVSFLQFSDQILFSLG